MQAAELGYLGQAKDLAEKPRQLRAYCQWMARLVPHYRRLGVALEFDTGSFEGMYQVARTGRTQDLAVLAHCLIAHHRDPSPATVDRQVAELDATLALFQHAPALAGEFTETLAGTTVGLGARIHPDFAHWLDADQLLDRYLHLLQVLGEPVVIARAVIRDFQRQRRLDGERRYLGALENPDERQRARLAALANDSGATPERTRRWLASRIPLLLARAYRYKLDQFLSQLVFDICGVRICRAHTGLARRGALVLEC